LKVQKTEHLKNKFSDEEEVKKFFAFTKLNHDGKLSLEELLYCLWQHNQVYAICESDSCEKSYEELMHNLSLAITQEARFVDFTTKFMEKHDVSKTGSLSIEEVRAAVNFMREKDGLGEASEEEIKQVFASLDLNHDGKVTLEEFSTFMRKELYEECESEKEYKRIMAEYGLDI